MSEARIVSRITSAASVSSGRRRVAELVVHALQAVDVDEQQGDRGSGARRDEVRAHPGRRSRAGSPGR